MPEGSRINCIQGSGPKSASVLLVGEAPGAEEANQGEPFVGLSGRFLQKQVLHLAGVSRTSLRLDNAVRCRPRGNRTPTAGEVTACRPQLVEAIRKQKPKVIIAAGATPWKSVTNFCLKNIVRWQGIPVWSREFGCWIVPILHPAALLRTRSQYEIFNTSQYVERAMALAKEPAPAVPQVQTQIIETEKEHRAFLKLLRESREFVVDIETSNSVEEDVVSDFLVDRIVMVSFATQEGVGVCVPYEFVEREREVYRELFASDRLKIMHNSSFDMKFLAAAGFVMKKGTVFDTLLAHHLLDENFEKLHGLKFLAWRYTYQGGYELELEAYKRKNKIVDYSKIPLDLLGRYAAMDALVTYELKQKFAEQMQNEGVDKVFWNVVMPARRVLTKMEYVGIGADKQHLESIQHKLEQDLALLNKEVVARAQRFGLEKFNIDSSKQMQVLLFNKLKLPAVKQTKTGASTDIEVLKGLAGRHHVVDTLIDYRKLAKYKRTYVDGVIDSIRTDGRIHTSYLSQGTVTGRLSSTHPNLQNIPRDQDIKKVFIPSPGYVLVDADYNQAELRGLTHYSQDAFMLKAYKEDQDIHTMVAVEFYGVPPEQITKDMRVFIKTINFGIVYGRGAQSLARAMHITIPEAEAYLAKYFQKFASVLDFIKSTIKFAEKHGYIQNVFGRRRRLPTIRHDDEYIRAETGRFAVNSLIQGTIADMTQTALARIDGALLKSKLKAHMLLQVHDSIVVEVVKKQQKIAAEVIKEEMEKPFPGFTVPMRADIKISECWGEENESLGYVWRDVRAEVVERNKKYKK